MTSGEPGRQEKGGNVMGTRKVLFVDDETEIIGALRRMLRSEPYETLFAQSGQEALDLMEREIM